jgi:hypothetical protein
MDGTVAPYVANLLRSLMPKILECGIATEQDIAIDTFEERYIEEVLRQRSVVQWWSCVGAWARKPSYWCARVKRLRLGPSARVLTGALR